MVGAGPSGLAAAHRLRQRGWPVIVFEETERLGGKLRTVTLDGFVLETGAALVSDSYDSLLDVAGAVGMADELIAAVTGLNVARGNEFHYIDTARLVRTAVGSRVLSWRSKAGSTRLVFDHRRARRFLHGGEPSDAGSLDEETALEYCERRLNLEIYDYVVDSCIRGINGTSGAKASAIDFFSIVDTVLGSRLSTFRRGMSSFAEALAGGADIRYGCSVVQVRDRGSDVEVEWVAADGRHHVQTGAGCVMAIPGDLVADVVVDLPTDLDGFLRRLRYTTMVNLNVGLSSRPAGLRGFCIQIPRPVSEGLFTISLDHNNSARRAPEGKGLVGLYTTSEWAQTLIGEDDETVTRLVVDEADRVVNGIGDLVDFARVNRWPRSLVYGRPGLYSELRDFNCRRPRDGRIHLAGDYLGAPNLNTAVASGESAAREFDAALRGASNLRDSSGRRPANPG